MKIKKTKDRKSGSEVFVVKPTKHEELVYDQAEWLMGKPHPNLADFRYTLEGKETVLYYDAYGLSDLKTYAKAPFGSVVYQKFLVALCELMALCTKMQLPTSSLRLTPDNVLMSPDGTPYFLFIPLSNKPSTNDDTPSALLQWISDRSSKSSIRFVVAEDERHADALFDYVKRNPVFSLTSFQKFLSSEFGISLQAEGSGPLSSATAARRVENVPAQQAAAPVAAAFDPMALLHNAPSASEVKSGQTLANRVRDAVADVSPTAASRTAVRATSKSADEDVQPAASAVNPQLAVDPVEEDFVRLQQPDNPPAHETAPAPDAQPIDLPAPSELSAPLTVPASIPENAHALAVDEEHVPQQQRSFVQDWMPASSSQPVSQAPKEAGSAPVSGGTSLLGAGVISRAGGSVAQSFASPTETYYLERVKDGTRYIVRPDQTLVVGRGSACDLRIEGNSNVSRTHAQIRLVNSTLEVVDLGSSNGTTVQNVRLMKNQSSLLPFGGKVCFADETFVFTK